MSLTNEDLVKIERVVKNVVKKEIGMAKEELLEEIHKVGVEVVENRTVILQHIHTASSRLGGATRHSKVE